MPAPSKPVEYICDGPRRAGRGAFANHGHRGALLRRKRRHATGDLHAPFGCRHQQSLGLALRKRFCRSFNFELQAAATDNGLNISLSEQHSFPLGDVFHYLHAESVQEVLEQACARVSALHGALALGRRTRSLALAALSKAARKFRRRFSACAPKICWRPFFRKRIACQENIVGDIEIPDHISGSRNDEGCAHRGARSRGPAARFRAISRSGSIRCLAVIRPMPSVFSHEILNANPYAYLDDAPLEERRARAVEMRRVLPQSIAEEFGRLDPAAIAEVRADAWPDVRDADELHDALMTLARNSKRLCPMWAKPRLRPKTRSSPCLAAGWRMLAPQRKKS
jgi:ATP-dependent Lhr-like helicase